MKAALVVTAVPNPAEAPAMKEYLERVGPVLAGGGGQVSSRSLVQEVVSGSPDYAMVFVMDFETPEAAKAALDSPEYQDLVPLRDKGFARMEVSIAAKL